MIWQLHCCPTLPSLCWQINSYQPPSGFLSVSRSASGRSACDLRRQLTAGSALSPKSCLPSSFAEAAEDKSGLSSIALARRMIFFGAPPSIPPCGFSVLVTPQKSRRGHRLERYATPVYLCLSPLAARPPEGHWRAHSAAAPCRPVGFQGRSALVAPGGAKSPSCSAAGGGDIRPAACRRRGGTPGRNFPDSRNRTPPRSA